ncbi:Kinesin-like protein kip2 [Massospora cicadina]|nr:Kinesin-like protein kip2 [Massospora cicadina]
MPHPSRSSSPPLITSQDGGENVRVSVRLKAQPLDPSKLSVDEPPSVSPWVVDATTWPHQIKLHDQFLKLRKPLPPAYSYDSVMTGSDNTQLYNLVARDIVSSAVEGFHGTIFAYGQTSSGKTYVSGSSVLKTMTGTEDEPGIIPQAVDDVFKCIKRAGNAKEFLLRISYFEIYNETIKDLLATEPADLKIHEDKYRGVFVAPLKEEIVTNPKQVMRILDRGEGIRAREQLTFSKPAYVMAHPQVIESCDGQGVLAKRRGLHSKSPSQGGVKLSYLVGRPLTAYRQNLIDLAGSEKSTSHLERRKEAAFINKSLLTLGAVISKISDGKTGHIPFRDSKLTRILQTTLMGNCRIGVICTINQDAASLDESINTLRFGSRVKTIHTRPKVNQVADDKALLQKYLNEITDLNTKLSDAEIPKPPANLAQEQELEALRQQNQRYEEEVMELHLARTAYKERIDHLTKLILSSSSMGDKVFKRSRPMSVHIGHQTTNPLAPNPRLSYLGKQKAQNERLEWALEDVKFKSRYIKQLEGLLQSLAPGTPTSPAKVYECYLEIQSSKENWDGDSHPIRAEKEKAMEERVSTTLGRVASLRLSRHLDLQPPMHSEPPPKTSPKVDSLTVDDIIEEQNKVIMELEQERKFQSKAIADLKDRIRHLEMQQFRRAELVATTPAEGTSLQIRIAELEVALEAEREWRKKHLQPDQPPIPPPRLRPPPTPTDPETSTPAD